MWKAPGYRSQYVRMQMRQARSLAKKKRVSFHLKRASATVQPIHATTKDSDPPKIPARLVLNEMTDKALSLFSSESLNPGQEVELTVGERLEKKIYYGRVIHCHLVPSTRKVISPQHYPYRIYIEL